MTAVESIATKPGQKQVPEAGPLGLLLEFVNQLQRIAASLHLLKPSLVIQENTVVQ